MDSHNINALSDYFFHCRNEGVADGQLARPSSLVDAYYIQHSNYGRLGVIGGWKLGGCSSTSRDFFGIENVYYGPIFAENIFRYDSKIYIPRNIDSVIGELEIVFRLSDSIVGYKKDEMSEDKIISYISSVSAAVEMPRVIFPITRDCIFTVIADQCVTGWLVLGHEHSIDCFRMDTTENLFAILSGDNRQLLSGKSGDIIGGPLTAFRDFIKLAQQHNLDLLPGQVVSTGAFSICDKLPFNTRLQANFDCLGEFDFIINQL